MKSKPYLLLIIIGLLLVIFFIFKNKLGTDVIQESYLQLQLNQLRGVAKLVIWEQDFTLNHQEKIEKDYAGIFTTSEKITSNIEGKMGFHIDLSDSINTKIHEHNDTIFITAPLSNTYIELDLATLNQVKEKSLDPTINLKKEEVIKKLRQRALEEFVPNLQAHLSKKDLEYQQSKLSNLVKKPVIINISAYPTIKDMKWKSKGLQ